MATQEIKSEIQDLLENMPDNILQELLDYLKQAKKETNDKLEFSRHFGQILREDKELLEKLAQ
ncbi:MAG TPA: hypothetical protein VFM65_09200 [Flavobacteriaceae bacterium]|nr:hypothetical protein [Flavobacteriaceae bacterium]